MRLARIAKLGCYGLIGVILANTAMKLALTYEVAAYFVFGFALLWCWSITEAGHRVGMQILQISEEQWTTVRMAIAIIAVVGALVEFSFWRTAQ